ncbi:ion channel [Vibrio sp. WXL210]|uniref:ion channel n=1 Tax=Vibrio sp. WXL210 TaxID=3450709 RepID=UPI003EC676C6
MTKKLIKLWDDYFSQLAEGLSRVNAGAIALGFALIVYAVYFLLGESELIASPIRFVYLLVVTGSTVGYGDFSPSTELGQLFTAFFVIPVAIGMFGLIAGKIVARVASIWYRKIKGMHTVTHKNHIVVIGYNRNRTPSLIRQLIREEVRKIVLVSCEQAENPMPDMVDFINVPSFTNEEELSRVALDCASCIIVDTDSDENTLTIALFVSQLNKNAHLVAHFIDIVKGRILKQQCPNAEVISNLSTELLAKSVIDSGSSLVHSELVSAAHGQTQYSIEVTGKHSFVLRDVFMLFKEETEATIIGLRRQGVDAVVLNVNLSTVINPQDTLYYISDERIQFDNWPVGEE